MLRLGHISFFGLAFLNFVFALTSREQGLRGARFRAARSRPENLFGRRSKQAGAAILSKEEGTGGDARRSSNLNKKLRPTSQSFCTSNAAFMAGTCASSQANHCVRFLLNN
jgi:hypothetical protein